MLGIRRFWLMVLLLVTGWSLVLAQEAPESLTVGNITITGVKKTRPITILRIMTLREGDVVPTDEFESLLEENENNISNLGLFTRVALTHVRRANEVDVFIDVQERWYIWPSPTVALEERTFGEWWEDKDLDRLILGLGISWQNFTGNNDRLYGYGQIGYTRRASLTYNRPFLFPKSVFDGTVSFLYVNNKEIGYTTVDGILQLARLQEESLRQYYIGSIGFGKRFGPRAQLQWAVGYQYFRPNDSIVFFNDRYLTDGAEIEHYPTLRVGYVRDERDVRAFPLDGYKYYASAQMNGFPGLGTSRFGKIRSG